ncbi:MAG: hypothetical protein Q9170_002189 [Blastenia crenularia]
MSFLFGRKSKQTPGALPPATRDVHTSGGSRSASAQQQPNGVTAKGPTPTPGSSVSNSIGGPNTPSPEQGADQRPSQDQESQYASRTPPSLTGSSQPPNVNNAALFPWSQRRLTFTSPQPIPFPRYGAAVNAVASKEGDLYLMGGLVNGSTVKGDLWMIEAGAQTLPCYPVGTTYEGPGPRVGHRSLLVGNAFIVFGGDTKIDDRDKLDDTLYLLNTCHRPAGRYGHTLNILGSKIYVFGGQVEGCFFNDLWAFDLNALQNANSKWEMLIPNSLDGGPPEGQIPPARTNHSTITWNDKLYLFGGTNGTQWFNDVWAYDARQLTWTQLDCIGYIPTQREGHSAALVNDVMYIFGGRTEDGTDLGDLAAFKITSRRWFTFQNMGPGPSPRSGHTMTAFGKQIVVAAGEPSSAPRNSEELSMVYVLDTAKIRYPNDQQIQQTPSGERVPGNRRPSTERAPRGAEPLPMRGALPQGAAGGPSEGLRRVFSGSRESMVGPGAGPPSGVGPPSSMGLPPGAGPGPGSGQGPASRVHDMSTVMGPPGSSPPASRLPQPVMGQAPPGPPPQQQAPPPRPNGVLPLMGGPRSKTPTKDQRGYGPPVDTERNGSFERENVSPLMESPQQEGLRSVSPKVNGRRTPNQQTPQMQQPVQQPMRPMPNGIEPEEAQMTNPESVRSRSRQAEQQAFMESPGDYSNSSMQTQQPLQPQQPQQPLQNQRSFNRDYEAPGGMGRPPYETNKERSPIQAQQLQQLEELKMQQEGLQKQLEVVKNQNAWYVSELVLAKKAGYQQSSPNAPLDERSFDDDERPLIEALISMRAQLAEVQQSVDSRVNAAAEEVAQVEHQRDVAIREAAYAKAKVAALGGSHTGTPVSEATSRDMVAEDRSNDLGRKLAVALATQNELHAKIASMTADMDSEKHARELAESTAEAAQARARELHEVHNPDELESLKEQLHNLSTTVRDESAQRSEAHSRAGILESDRDDLSRRLNEALENIQQHSNIFISLREAVSASDEKACHLERKLDEERAQRDLVDQKLLQLRGEHEERTAELETTTRKLRDAEEMAENHANESRKHREVVLEELDKIGTRDLGASTSAAVDERVLMLQQQVEEAHGLVRQHQVDADAVAEKLRRAEERVARLEAYKEQSSSEGLAMREQLQEAVREARMHQTRHGEAERELESHRHDASALFVQHNALRELLEERPEKERSRPSTPEQNRMHDLEEQLENSLRSHEETKADYEAREQEADKMYREKLELLESDYQSAVGYVKGTEKMLKHMKDELSKYKVELNKYRKQNQRLQEELDGAQSRSIEPEAAAEWEQERQSLRREIDEMQASVKDSVSQLERQMEDIQQELYAAQEERDHFRHDNEQAQQHLAHTTQQAQRELDQLKNENSMLESRALDAENKVTLLLDQVGNSVTNYRRQSQQMHMNGHNRNLSTNSTATVNPPDPIHATNAGPPRSMHSTSNSVATDTTFPANSNRNSMALDHLASELENLRTHWEGTHRNYRLSNQFDFERTPTSATTTGGNGELSESLANWRRRLDAEEHERSNSPKGHQGGPVLDFGGTKTAGVGATTVDPRVALEICGDSFEDTFKKRVGMEDVVYISPRWTKDYFDNENMLVHLDAGCPAEGMSETGAHKFSGRPQVVENNGLTAEFQPVNPTSTSTPVTTSIRRHIMIAVTSPPTALPHHPSNHHGNLHQYLSAQIRQLSPERSSKASMGRTSVRQDHAQAVEPNQKPIRRVATELPRRSIPNGGLAAEHDEIGATTDGDAREARPGALARSNTDVGPRRTPSTNTSEPSEDNWELRHGYEEQYSSDKYLDALKSNFYMYFTDKRHETGGKPRNEDPSHNTSEWRMRDRLKTVSAALTICLNIGVDPPDVVKTNPTAKLECWVDPTAAVGTSNKTMEQIGKKLQEQYEGLSIRVRYKPYLDPSVDETKKFCTSLRRNAKDERILFHYNGHGVPLPTPSGEIWVFNRNYTQYIPVSLYDLQVWLGAPSLFVFDCSNAGNIIANFDRFVAKHEEENAEARKNDPNVQLQSYGDNIQLAACGKLESLPTSPDLPADLFTCCLTTPIDISLRSFVLENPMLCRLSLKDVTRIPGRLADRRSPLGELNWIFTAITDTIAWNLLPRATFKKLFRQDLMVAALFRNFLLSERIMRANGCHPMSVPSLPETHNHPLWQAWDLTIEMVLSQLPAMIAAEEGGPLYEYQHSDFFAEQLTAFEVYLSQGAPNQEAPSQLPIVLQVLLSQVHRLRALILLSRFLDMGAWAVNLALTIGIFPYVLKLLQSAAFELKPVMIFIWARILAVDGACQADLIKDNGYQYFLNMLNPNAQLPVQNASEHRAMCAFIVAMFCRGFSQGQTVCLSPELIETCMGHLQDKENPLLRQWSCLCISMLWENYPEAKWVGIRCQAHQRLCEKAVDDITEVRAAAVHALTNFLGIPDLTAQVAHYEDSVASTIMIMTNDGSSMVRRELLVFFSTFVKRYQNKFLVAAFEQLVKEKEILMQSNANGNPNSQIGRFPRRPSRRNSQEDNSTKVSQNSVQSTMWMHLLIMAIDPHPEVAQDAKVIVDYVHEKLLDSPLGPRAQPLMDEIVRSSKRAAAAKSQPSSRQPSVAPIARRAPTAGSPAPPTLLKSESYLSMGMRRTASVAAALKHLTFGTAEPPPPLTTSTTPHQRLHGGPLRSRVPAEWTKPPDVHDPAPKPMTYVKAKAPKPKGFAKRDPTSAPSIPLKSSFFDWSIEVLHFIEFTADHLGLDNPLTRLQYFGEPQMRPVDTWEPGSSDYNQRLWRQIHNEKVLAETQPLKGVAGTSKWDVAKGFFNNGTQPMKMCFHQFEDHLAIADDRDSICIWDWSKSVRLSRFSNSNPPGTRVNEARFINEDDQALLLSSSSDGIVRVFRNYESESSVELVSAFRALNNLENSTKNAGLVMDWQQGQGRLLVTGDVKFIRVWNVASEVFDVVYAPFPFLRSVQLRRTKEIPTRSSSPVTSLTTDAVAGQSVIAGYGDGTIRLFDLRKRPQNAMSIKWSKHNQWITNVHMQRGGLRELVSGCRDGEVKLWDLRMKEDAIKTIRAVEGTMRGLCVHEHAPVFAA